VLLLFAVSADVFHADLLLTAVVNTEADTSAEAAKMETDGCSLHSALSAPSSPTTAPDSETISSAAEQTERHSAEEEASRSDKGARKCEEWRHRRNAAPVVPPPALSHPASADVPMEDNEEERKESDRPAAAAQPAPVAAGAMPTAQHLLTAARRVDGAGSSARESAEPFISLVESLRKLQPDRQRLTLHDAEQVLAAASASRNAQMPATVELTMVYDGQLWKDLHYWRPAPDAQLHSDWLPHDMRPPSQPHSEPPDDDDDTDASVAESEQLRREASLPHFCEH
jgi:hypothetical protein